MRVNRWFCCALIASAVTASEAVRGENKFRTGEGGVWGNGAMWNPAGVPAEGDNVFQDASATGELVVSDDVSIGMRPASLTVTPGGAPARAFRISSGGIFYTTGSFRKLGTEPYTVTLESGAEFLATALSGGPGVTGGDWILHPDAFLDVREGIDFQDGSCTIAAGAILRQLSAAALTVGDTETSRIALEGADAIVALYGSVQIAYVDATSGSFFLASNGLFEVYQEAVFDGATASAVGVRFGDDSGVRAPIITLKNGGRLGVLTNIRVRRGATFRYEGTGNTLNAPLGFTFDAGDAVLQPGSGGGQLELGFGDRYAVETDADNFDRWDARGVTLFGAGGLITSTLELTYGDYDGILFTDVPCVSYAGLVVRSVQSGENFGDPSLVKLVDDFDNAFRGSPAAADKDSLYVNGDVTIEAGSTLDLNGLIVYYTGALNADPNQIIGEGSVIQVPALMFGDFDGDCDVDLTDFAVISQGFTGSGGLTHLPLTDGDCDRDTDLTDFAHFSQNFTGSGTGCGESLMGGGGGGQGGPSAAEAAAWCCDHLDRATRAAFAARIEAVLDAGHEGADRDRLVELGRLLQ